MNYGTYINIELMIKLNMEIIVSYKFNLHNLIYIYIPPKEELSRDYKIYNSGQTDGNVEFVEQCPIGKTCLFFNSGVATKKRGPFKHGKW